MQTETSKSKFGLYSFVLLIIYLGAAVVSFFRAKLEDGLDPSWQFSLNYASSHQFSYGNDIIFTYGPLGFLGYDITTGLTAPLIALSLLIKGIYLCYVYFLLLEIANRLVKNDGKDLARLAKYILVPWLVFQVAVYGEFTTLFFITLIHTAFLAALKVGDSYLGSFFSNKKNLLAGFIGFTAAMLFFVKVSFLPFIIAVPFTLVVHFIMRKRYGSLLWFVGAFAVTFLMIFFSFKIDLKGYLFNSIEIIAGYKKAMQMMDWPTYNSDVFLSMAIIAVFGCALLYVKNLTFFKKHFLLLGVILLSTYFLYTYSFTRGFPGGLILNFPFLVIVIYLGTYLHDEFNISKKLNSLMLLILVMSATVYLHGNVKNFIGGREYVQLDKIPKQVIHQRETYDAYPFLTSICYYNDLNYKPRPVIQSYSAYTEKLDQIDGAFYAARKVDNIIFAGTRSNAIWGNAIDKRYFLFDEPYTKLQILKNYSITAQVNDSLFIVSKRATPIKASLTLIDSKKIAMGQEYPVKADSAKLYFFTASIKYTTRAKLISLIRRFPNIKLSITLASGKVINFNAVPELLNGPCLLNKYCDNYNDYFKLMGPERASLQDVRSIKFSSSGGSGFADEIGFKIYTLNSVGAL